MKNIYKKKKKHINLIKRERTKSKVEPKKKVWVNWYYNVGGNCYYKIGGKQVKVKREQIIIETKISKESCRIGLIEI
jgi:hypothetical protein